MSNAPFTSAYPSGSSIEGRTPFDSQMNDHVVVDVEHDDGVTVPQQTLNEVAADKTGPPVTSVWIDYAIAVFVDRRDIAAVIIRNRWKGT